MSHLSCWEETLRMIRAKELCSSVGWRSDHWGTEECTCLPPTWCHRDMDHCQVEVIRRFYGKPNGNLKINWSIQIWWLIEPDICKCIQLQYTSHFSFSHIRNNFPEPPQLHEHFSSCKCTVFELRECSVRWKDWCRNTADCNSSHILSAPGHGTCFHFEILWFYHSCHYPCEERRQQVCPQYPQTSLKVSHICLPLPAQTCCSTKHLCFYIL